MTSTRQGLEELARNVMRVLLVYALVLQGLAPLAVVRADARDGLGGQAVLCSAMTGSGAERHGQGPRHVVHDCLSCCLGNVTGVLATPSAWPEPAGFPLPTASPVPETPLLPARPGSPPPQRAPPGLV